MKSIDIKEIDNSQLFRAKIGSLNTDIYDHINWKPENKYDFFYNISLSKKRYIGDKIPFDTNERRKIIQSSSINGLSEYLDNWEREY
jgi:hypothetical protein